MTRISTLPALLAMLVTLTLSGCSQWYFDMGTPLSEQELPQSGSAASMSDVLAVLGPPHRLSASVNGYIFAWEYWRVTEDSFGLNLSPLGIDFMSADVATVNAEGEFLLATFDRQHKLSGVTFSRWDNQVGDGKALQPFGALDVAKTRDLVGDFPQHTYGAAMLRRLPKALNSNSDLDLGQHGIEQRATPEGVGQRSLE